MNRDDVIRMAREAGFAHIAEADYWHPYFERFAALVAAHEREACAQVCDENEKIQWEICEYCKALMATQIANIIRARGRHETSKAD